MNISKYIFVTVTAVLFVFIEQSYGNIPASLVELAEFEKMMTDPKFQELQEAIIMASSDADSLAARAVIEDIRKEVRKFPVYLDFPVAVNTAIEGVLDAIRLVRSVVRQAHKSIDVASNLLKAGDTKGATDAIKKGLKSNRELVYIAGVAIHDAQGFALALVGSLAIPGLKNAMTSIQTAGVTIIEALDVADLLATDGIKIGGRAADKALYSARNIVSTGSLSVYNHLKEAAIHSLEGLQYAVSKSINEVDVVPAVINGLRTQISTDNSAALDAISRLSSGLQSVLSVSTKKPVIDAVNITYEGLKSTIIETADAMSTAKNCFEEAGKRASEDKEAAVAAVRMGIKAAEQKLFSASAFGYLALGAAGQISGKSVAEELVPAVLEMQYGRAAAYDDLKVAERISIIAIRGGKSAADKGISTALQICDAAGIALFQDFEDAAKMSFEVFQKV